MNIDQDIHDHVLSTLPHKPAEAASLAALSTQELVVRYLNWLSRGVRARPRKVHVSAKLNANPLRSSAQYKGAVDALIAEISTGADLQPHLSRAMTIGYQAPQTGPKKLLAQRDLDLLLNDWGVHHLHLSTTVEADGFVTRTGPLLFAVFRPDDAYLVDIFKHGSWSDRGVVETIVREWPAAGLIGEAKGALGLAHESSSEDIGVNRSAGTSTALTIDGRVYIPTGVSTAGTATVASLDAIGLRKAIRWLVDELATSPTYLTKVLAEHGHLPPPKPDWHFVLMTDGFGVQERQTGIFLRLGFWRFLA
jgi:hypothetical protein